MKEFEYLALKSYEFIDMLDVIARERNTLKVKKKTENEIALTCQIAIPMAHIKYCSEEINGNLKVTRRVNWFPIIYSTIPILALLELILFLIIFFTGSLTFTENWEGFLLVGLAWVLALVFIIYQIFSELENITKKLFKVKV